MIIQQNPYWTEKPEKKFDIRKLMPKFETISQVKIESENRISVLKKGDKECRILARKLKKCSKLQRCKSPACPKCSRKFRMWFVEQILQNITKFEKSHSFNPDQQKFVTIVPINSAIEADDLLSNDCTPKLMMRRMKDRLRNQLTRAKLTNIFVFGGIEIDFDTETQSWEPHFHLIISGLDRSSNAWSAFIENNAYSQGKWGDTPIQIDALKNKPKQVSYVLKSYFSRKEKWRNKSSNIKKCKKYRLTKNQERSALLFLNHLDFEDRIFLFKARRYGKKLKTSVCEKLDEN